jgi:holo-[acyl-carrier protein] synthase
VLKSLGLGGRKGVSWAEIEVDLTADTAPQVTIAGGCAEVMREQRIDQVLLTTSYCRSYATAYALAARSADDE